MEESSLTRLITQSSDPFSPHAYTNASMFSVAGQMRETARKVDDVEGEEVKISTNRKAGDPTAPQTSLVRQSLPMTQRQQ